MIGSKLLKFFVNSMPITLPCISFNHRIISVQMKRAYVSIIYYVFSVVAPSIVVTIGGICTYVNLTSAIPLIDLPGLCQIVRFGTIPCSHKMLPWLKESWVCASNPWCYKNSIVVCTYAIWINNTLFVLCLGVICPISGHLRYSPKGAKLQDKKYSTFYSRF